MTMVSADLDWPEAPKGVGYAGRLDDIQLSNLVEALRRNESDVWLSKVKPPEEPPSLEGFADVIQKDILGAHRANWDAVPDRPTDSYRREALEYFSTVKELRDEIRPDSLTPQDELPDGIRRQTDEDWVHYFVTDTIRERSNDLSKDNAEITEGGKYLFFTPEETGVLESIIFEQFQGRPFQQAKVPSKPNRQDDALLCLYFEDNRYEEYLRAEYQNEEDEYGLASPHEPDKPIIMPRGYGEGR